MGGVGKVNIQRIPVYLTFHNIRPNHDQILFLLLYKGGERLEFGHGRTVECVLYFR